MKFVGIDKETGTEPRVPLAIIKLLGAFTEAASVDWAWKPYHYAVFLGPEHPDPSYAPELRNRTSNSYRLGKKDMASLVERFKANSLSPKELEQGWREVEINKACLALGIKPLSLKGI